MASPEARKIRIGSVTSTQAVAILMKVDAATALCGEQAVARGVSAEARAA